MKPEEIAARLAKEFPDKSVLFELRVWSWLGHKEPKPEISLVLKCAAWGNQSKWQECEAPTLEEAINIMKGLVYTSQKAVTQDLTV